MFQRSEPHDPPLCFGLPGSGQVIGVPTGVPGGPSTPESITETEASSPELLPSTVGVSCDPPQPTATRIARARDIRGHAAPLRPCVATDSTSHQSRVNY